MKAKIQLLIVSVLFAVTFVSCDQKERFVNHFEDFVADVEENGRKYTQEDWENSVNEFEELSEQTKEYKDLFNSEDYQELGRLTARYYKAVITFASGLSQKELFNMEQFLDGYIEEIGGVTFIEDLDDTWIDDVDGFERNLDEMASAFEEIFDD